MFFLVNNRAAYRKQQAVRGELERFLDDCADHTRVGIFAKDSDYFPGNYVLELNSNLYVLKKSVQANIDLIKRSSDREVIARGKVNIMKYKGNAKIYL